VFIGHQIKKANKPKQHLKTKTLFKKKSGLSPVLRVTRWGLVSMRRVVIACLCLCPRFIKEEPHRLDKSVVRCRQLSGTLSTLKKFVHSSVVYDISSSPTLLARDAANYKTNLLSDNFIVSVSAAVCSVSAAQWTCRHCHDVLPITAIGKEMLPPTLAWRLALEKNCVLPVDVRPWKKPASLTFFIELSNILTQFSVYFYNSFSGRSAILLLALENC